MNFRIYPILYSNCTQQRKKEIKPLGVPRGSGGRGLLPLNQSLKPKSLVFSRLFGFSILCVPHKIPQN